MDLMDEVGLGARMHAEGLVHEGVELRFDGEGHRIALKDLTGRAITIYGQQEVVKDLIEARLASDLPLYFEVSDVAVDPARRRVTFTHEARAHVLEADLIAGCDGFHGVCRPTIAGRADGLRARVPVRLDGDPGRVRAVLGGAHLRAPRARVRARLACARTRSRACTCSASPTTEPHGRTSAIWDELRPPLRHVRQPRARSSRRASRRCARSWSSRCSTSGCSWPATPRTSSRPPAPRA